MKRSFTQENVFKAITVVLMTVSSLALSGQGKQEFASNSASGEGWTIKDPFKSEVFIRNNGQFNNPDGQPLKDVQYGINNGEMKVYFTPFGLSYHVTNIQVASQYKEDEHEVFEEIERHIRKHEKQDESLKKYFDDRSAYVNIEWIGANPNARILVSDKVHDNYSYSVKNENEESQSIIASAYKKLTYKNIYPNIDIEYYFPDNAGKGLGVKYNIIVHPGGELSKVKMKYSGMQHISLDKKGNIIAAIPDGNITDHAPDFSFVGTESNQVPAKFILQDQTVSFDIPQYDKTQKLVIDPFTSVWSINPGFTTANDGYTIRVDYYQNVYVMGGGVSTGGFVPGRNYQVKKFNPSGALQWTAITGAPNSGLYGDMVVLRTGRVIVGHAFGSGTAMYILDPANGAITNKATLNEPGWRLSYNLNLNNGVLWMGGGSNNGAHLYKTDTNIVGAVAYHPWTAASNTEDICYLAQDKAGSFVYVTNSTNTSPNSSATAPKFVKASTATPGTAVWKVNEPSLMMEAGQGSFMNGGTASMARGWATGVNGMVVCNDRIYTYDGNIIRAYDPANGNIVNTVTVGGAFDKYSGIDVDDCCRVYVGVNGVIKRYSSTLVLDASFNVTSDVYDLRFDPLDDDYIYVTGKGFVQKLKRNACPTCINATKTDISGCTYGTATATVNDQSATAPFTYSWNTNPVQTTQSVSGLSAGTYIVTVTDAASPCPLTWKDTVVITGTYVPCGPTVTATGGTICSGVCMNITATGTSTPGPFTYSWNPGSGTSSSFNVCPTTTTTYTVVATDGAGATASTTAVVTVNPVPVVSVSPATICNGTSTTLTASGADSYTWSPATGLSSTTGTTVTANPTATTTYTITGSFATGCTGTTTVIVTVNPNPIVTVPPASICPGGSSPLTASGADTYSWSPGTGLSGTTGTTVTANPGTTSTYTVIGTTNGCTGSTTVVVTVGALIADAGTDAAICSGASTTLGASGGTLFTWTPATGLSSTSTSNPVASPTATTTYTVNVSDGNCADEDEVVVTVNPNPVVNVPAATICNGASTGLTASGADTYTWSPATGLSSTTGATVTANPATTTTYTVTGSFATGCTGSVTVVVTVNPNPVITVPSATICEGQTTSLTAGGADMYTWSPATGLNTTTGTSVTANPITTTTYTVTGTTTATGCTGSVTVVVTVNPPCGPGISATGATVCEGVCATATSTASGGVLPYTYLWDTGETTASINVCPAATTTYTVTVTDNSIPVGTATAIAVITVNPNPLVTVPPATICAGESATLTASGADTYSWTPVTGLNSGTGISVTANPTATTTYTVTGSYATGCTGTTEVIVTVNPIPVVTAPDANICPGGSTTLNATGANTYAWSPSTGLSATTGTSVTANPASTITYTVIGTSNGCTASTTVTVTVGALVANAGADVFICSGASTNLNASGGTIFSWTPATGLSNANISNPTANPTTTTTYTVTVSDGTCSDDDEVVVTVNSTITLNAAGVDVSCNAACNGQLIVIPNGGTSPYTYSWNTGCTTAACNNICAGFYNLTATDAMGCTATATATVNEPTVLISSLSNQTNVSCFGLCDGTASVSVNGGTAPYNYSWLPGGGAVANVTGLCAGSYTCTVTDANNCTAKTFVTITQPTQIAVTTTGASICPGGSATLTANTTGGSGAVTITWSPSTGLSATSGATVIASPGTTTIYTIAGTDGNGCIGTTSVTVTVNPAPVITVPSASICQGASTTLNANGASTYTWSPATNLSATTGATVIASPNTTTTYTIVGTNAFGCTNSTTVIVTVNLAPVVTATSDSACPGDTIRLLASGATTYSWMPATGLSTITGSTVIASPINTTVYTITGTSANGCTATAIATATINPEPIANYTTSPDVIDEFNPTIYFTDQSTGGTITTWYWSFGDSANTTSATQNPVFTYPAVSNTYTVQLIVTNQYGCIDSVENTVFIRGIFTFYIPNSFTPNDDGINDVFLPRGVGIDEEDYHLWIFDRWGNLIWETTIWGEAWDGKANKGADIAQIDTYVWKVHVKEKDSGAKHNYIGHVNIVK